MISPAEIREKAERIWNSQKPLRAEWTGTVFFPVEIPFRKPIAAELLENFSLLRSQILDLKSHSKVALGYGYELELSVWSHRQLGAQPVPAKIRIDTLEDLCRLIGKSKDLARWRQISALIAQQLPELKPWITSAPLKVLKFADEWPTLLSVVEFLRRSPRPSLFIRQLQIPGVDTKFIEGHKKILQEILDLVLAETAVEKSFTQLEGGGFEQRYGFLYDEALVRFRSLDPANNIGSYSDLSVPLSHLAKHPVPCRQVFLVENKINALAFPFSPNAIVIFGAGYAIAQLQRVLWLADKDICYWGDIDTHGFSILSALRSFLPRTSSLLMDRETLMDHRRLWGIEPENARYTRDLPHLTDEEQELFHDLRTDKVGNRVRLEQERIPFNNVLKQLSFKIFHTAEANSGDLG